jgi:hypothetical protein
MKKIMHIILYSCRKATELIDKRSVMGLSWMERTRLFMHKSLCDACTTYDKQSRLIDRFLHHHLHDHQEENAPQLQNDELKERIIERL